VNDRNIPSKDCLSDSEARDAAWHSFANSEPAPSHRDCFRAGWVCGKGYARSAVETSRDTEDAARYRFLRQPGNAIVYAADPNAWGHKSPGHIRYNDPEALDTAVDTARAAVKTPPEQG